MVCGCGCFPDLIWCGNSFGGHVVECFYFVGPKRFVGGFEDNRYVVGASVFHKHFEESHSEHTFADTVVAVDARAQAFLTVVEVDGREIFSMSPRSPQERQGRIRPRMYGMCRYTLPHAICRRCGR